MLSSDFYATPWDDAAVRIIQTNFMPFNSHTVLIVATVLFVLGLVGVLTRKNVMFILISVEVMLNAAGLAFVAAGSRWGQPDGQVMFLFILAMAAAEVSIGLALILQIYNQHKSLNVDELKELKDETESLSRKGIVY
jgi:NADH-quinone oxidoreductase subunit K